MAFVCDKSPDDDKSLEIQDNPDLEDGEIEDDDDDEEPTQEPENTPEIKTESATILPAAVPTDISLFNATTDKTEKTKRHPDKKGKGHLTEAEKCVRMLHKLEREARDRRERERRREQVSDDWAGNVEKAIASVLKKPGQSGSDFEEEETDNKRARKRKKKERERKKKHRKLEQQSPKEEIDENEMLNVRGASPPDKEPSPFTGEGGEAPSYESYESEYDSDSFARQNKRSFERERKRERNRNREQRRERKNFREKNNRKKEENRPQQQDANSLCMFYMQGKCHKGDDCPYSHDALPPMKLELCKFYLMDCCAKRDKCLYMHSEFPCKYYHTGLKCVAKDSCKFAHGKPLSDSLKQVLLKHLETAPKEILGEFPRLSREGAQHMVNQTQHNLELQYGIKPAAPAAADKATIPSLFDITIPMPLELMQDAPDPTPETKETAAAPPPKEKKVRQTRWNDGPAIPVANILLNPAFVGAAAAAAAAPTPVQVFPQLNQQDQQKLQEYQMNYQIKGFYSEQDQDMRINSNGDVDMRTLQPQLNFEQYCQDAKLTSTLSSNPTPQVDAEKVDTPTIPEQKVDNQNIESLSKMDVDIRSDVPLQIVEDEPPTTITTPETTTTPTIEEIPNLPKKQRELFLRIQAQQKENPPENEEKEDESVPNDDDWYSSDDENDPLSKMVIHLEDEDNPIRTDDESEPPSEEKRVFSPPQILIKPVEVIDKLGDLSKIDISDEVTKLLQTMQGKASESPVTRAVCAPPPTRTIFPEVKKSRDPRQTKLQDPEITSPKSSGSSSDPRTSKSSSGQAGTSLMSPKPERRLSSSQRITIYEQGIINIEEKKSIFEHAGKMGLNPETVSAKGDVDLRNLSALNALPEDLDLRQNYGDTDLRQQSGRQDVDLRQLGLPFKGMQNYTPASEIDASIASHSHITYKVHVCDIPRPDYTGLRLNSKEAEISADPRLKKIFRVPSHTEKDSPASPKQVPTSPKPPRQDPRRRNVITEEKPEAGGAPPPVLTYQQQLQLLQNSAFYQSLTSNQKVMLNQEIASKGPGEPHLHDPVLSGILSSLGLIPNQPHNAPAISILNNVNSMAPPILGQNLPNLLPMQGMPPNLMQPNLGPGLLGAAPPEFPINFDPRNGGLLGQAPPFQNFNENFQYNNNEEFYQNEQNFNPREQRGGNNFRGGNRRGGRNWNNRHNNRNYNNNNRMNRNRDRTNRSYTPP